MKVLGVIDKLDSGGSERVAVDLAIILSDSKLVEISFLCLLNPSVLDRELLENSIAITYLKRRNKYNPFTLLRVLSIFNKYDIVHIHSRQVLRYVGLLNTIPLKKNFKLVFHDHYGKIDTDASYTYYLKFCLKNVDAYIGVSTSLRNWAISNKLNKNVFLLPNIVRKQKQFVKKNNARDIIVIGNFRPQKNYEYLCELMSVLPEEVTIDLYGTVFDKQYYYKITNLVKKFRIEGRLNIIIGETAISKKLKNYKLALHCAASETGPLVAIEYMSQGLPIVMFNTGEVAKVLVKNNYDFVLNNFKLTEWKETVLALRSDLEKLKRTSLKISDIYHQNYSEERYLNKCLKIYQDIQNF